MLTEAITTLLAERSTALQTRNIDALEAMLAHDYCYVDSLGRCLPRDRYLASRRSGEVRMVTQKLSDVQVREIASGVVLATAILHDDGTFDGKPFKAAYRVTHVCRLESGAWRFVFGQSTTIELTP